MATVPNQYALVAAIDFGTTYSGYAFSLLEEYKKDPLKIHTKCWPGSRGLMSLKAPTSVLFNRHRTFDSFGYEAEDKYAHLAENGEEKEWYYFRRFKMILYNKMKLESNFELVSEDGKKRLPAMTIFSSCIQYLKDDLLLQCQNMKTGFEQTDICWVLSVPAIWNDVAKSFMRKAAEKAGIPRRQLLIALEPEAASIYCKFEPIKISSGSMNGSRPLQSGDKYIILDAGGGTIDVTVHKVHDDGTLRELQTANGGDWGGMKVDKAFDDFLVKIVGKVVMEKVKQNDKSDELELFREFEVKKRRFNPSIPDKITLRVPVALSETYENENGKAVNEAIAKTNEYKNKIHWVKDKLRIDADIFRGYFSDSLKNIGKHLERMFRCPAIKDVINIVMVGGYSESLTLQDFIKQKFEGKTVIIPSDPGLAVLKGSVLFGFNPHAIAERICRFTYGCGKSVPFIDGLHPLDKLYITDQGTRNCVDIFEKFAEIGEPIKVHEPQYETARVPADRKQKEITIRIFASVEENPTYVTDKSCAYLGTIRVPLTKAEGIDRRVRLKIFISGTEIEVEAEEENTDNKMLATLEFLG